MYPILVTFVNILLMNYDYSWHELVLKLYALVVRIHNFVIARATQGLLET